MGHSSRVMALSVMDERHVVSGALDGTLKLWNVESGEIVRTLVGHTNSVMTVAAVEGQLAVSGSDDGTLRLWDLKTGQMGGGSA